jgi:hypothetical protein
MDANARELGAAIRAYRQLVRHSFVDDGMPWYGLETWIHS